MNIHISTSILGARFSNLGSEINASASAGVNSFHFDIMDGHFVPNLTFGPMLLKALRPLTDLPFIAHLMVKDPDIYIDECIAGGASTVLVHLEASVHLHRSLQHIRQKGARAGVAVNPSSSLSFLPYVIDTIDEVLIMTVNPGFAAQAMIETVLPKIDEARKISEHCGKKISIGVDGGVNLETLSSAVSRGADSLIMASAFFNAADRQVFISRAREIAGNCTISLP
jgi:ribulose-phosphate 3-epimerase